MVRDGETFPWRGERLRYLVHPYNTTALNERAVEVPIARRWLADRCAGGVEVGNVLGHYQPTTHRVVDRYEPGDSVEPLDVFDLTGPVPWVLAVSTLEHVRWDPPEPPDPAGAIAACAHLRGLVAPGGSMLATIPLGQHPYLDGAVLSGGLAASHEAFLVWRPDGWDVTGRRQWGPLRERHWPSVVWVGEWET